MSDATARALVSVLLRYVDMCVVNVHCTVVAWLRVVHFIERFTADRSGFRSFSWSRNFC